MGEWYRIGIGLGAGAGVGFIVAAALSKWRLRTAVPAIVAAGLVAAYAAAEWEVAVAGIVGALVGTIPAVQLVRGSLARGGTLGGTALLVGSAGVTLALLAFVPGVGYAEPVAAGVLALRLRRRSRERYAGLRTLARD